jgi:hypothetical protein
MQSTTRGNIDKIVDALQEAINKTIRETVPIAPPSGRASPAWSEECSEIVHETRRLFRRYRDSGSPED